MQASADLASRAMSEHTPLLAGAKIKVLCHDGDRSMRPGGSRRRQRVAQSARELVTAIGLSIRQEGSSTGAMSGTPARLMLRGALPEKFEKKRDLILTRSREMPATS